MACVPFMERLQRRGQDTRALSGLRLCCIGPRAAEELGRYEITSDLVPTEFQTEGVIAAMTQAGMSGRRILIARAAVAREILPNELRAAGAIVDVVTVYRTIRPAGDRSGAVERPFAPSRSSYDDLRQFLHRSKLLRAFRATGGDARADSRGCGRLYWTDYGSNRR